MTLNKGYRNVYDLNIHLVLVTKYRRKVINRDILKRLHEIFADTCQKWRSELREFNGATDHVHLLINYPPDVEISKLVNNLKTVSSRLIRKEFAPLVNSIAPAVRSTIAPAVRSTIYSKPVFWSGAYFVASTGGTTLEQLKAYVESQKSPE